MEAEIARLQALKDDEARQSEDRHKGCVAWYVSHTAHGEWGGLSQGCTEYIFWGWGNSGHVEGNPAWRCRGLAALRVFESPSSPRVTNPYSRPRQV